MARKKPAAPPPWPAASVEMRAVAGLIPYARNSRVHSDEQVRQIAESIRAFGWTVPVLVAENGQVIAGHGRLMAAELLGIETVPVMVAQGWSEAQIRAYTIADNKLAENATWDDALLRVELQGLQAEGFTLGLTGFSPDEITRLLAQGSEGRTDPDDVPEIAPVAISRPGDIWILGNHRIVCGSSTDPATVERLLRGAQPRLMVTDPPYGVNYDPAWRKRAGLGGDGTATGVVLNDDRADWREAWALFPGAVAYVWHGGLHAAVVSESLRAEGFQIRAQIVWVKTRFALSRGHYHWQHEPAWYGVREGEEDGWRFEPDHEAAAYAVREGESAAWAGGRKQSTVWFIEHVKSETGHGTQKPVECMKRPIENNSQPGDAVYEPFSGSGTTIIAGEMTGRVVYAVELNPLYVDLAVRRWQAFIGREAVLEETGETFGAVTARRQEAAA